ncbi:MAG: L,D-transpeptidase [Chitinophagaceae bacterium]
MKFLSCVFLCLNSLLIISCGNDPDDGNSKSNPSSTPAKPPVNWKKAAKDSYHFESVKNWLEKGRKVKDTTGIDLILAVNRTDSMNLAGLDTIIVPDDFSGDIATYMNFPEKVSALKNVDKLIFFSYPTQTFGAYEHGNLVQAGPTNMGRKKDPTPTGLFFSNWKAVETTSTFNDEWNLRWNFNVDNKEGIGWHQYALPGYPASHSCMRLQTNDAKKLYDWADQWKLESKDSVLANGTPTIIFGSYDFDGKKPWLALVGDGQSLDIPEKTLNDLVQPNLERIIAEQEKTNKMKNTTASK